MRVDPQWQGTRRRARHENLERGNPVIIRLRYPSGVTHFVVISGKDGLDYLITDPGRRHADSPYPLKEFGSNIEALRYYEPVKGAAPPPP